MESEQFAGLRRFITETEPIPVDGERLLDELHTAIKRYLVLSAPACNALALWIVHTHCYQIFKYTPILHAKSPTKRCGKSNLLRFLREVVHNPTLTANITGPALFRYVHHEKPTMLIDEMDSMGKPGSEKAETLRNVLNCGFESGLPAIRCAPWPLGYEKFYLFGPKAVASIGSLPETVQDRAITIAMRRKLKTERIEALSNFDGTGLRQKCKLFAKEQKETLANARPEMPVQLNDRQQDIWQVLFAIADLAGGDWPERSRSTAIQLATADGDDSSSTELLKDIQDVFLRGQADWLFTEDLLQGLRGVEGQPWRLMTSRKLARMLAPFGIAPSNLRIGRKQAKGYQVEYFSDAFARYLS